MATSGGGPRGSVRQADNGTWYLIVDVGVGVDRRQTRRRGFATRKAAQAELTRVLGSLEQRTYVPPKRQTLAAFLTDVWSPAIEHTIKPGTFESYRRNVRLHIAGRPIGRRPLQEVEPPELNALYSALMAGDGDHRALGARSVAYVATILHRAFRDAVRWQALIRNPAQAADPPRPSAHLEMQTWNGRSCAPSWTRSLMIGCAAAGGCSRTPACAEARRSGCGGATSTSRPARYGSSGPSSPPKCGARAHQAWPGGTPKTAKGRRTVALDPATVTALRTHRTRQLEERLAMGAEYEDQDLVVCQIDGTPIHPKTISYQFEKAARAARLPGIRLHDLRHTHATLALKAGVHPRVVQERLGHANVSITLDTYSHVDMDMQAAAARRVAALITHTQGATPEIL